MQRRTALKQLGFLAGGALLLPSCLGKQTAKEATIQLSNIAFNGNQESTLAAMCEALIPKTDLPGAREVNAHHFVLRMMNDCYEPDAQQKFLKGFAQAQEAFEEKSGDAFEESTLAEQQAFLKDIEADKVSVEGENNLKFFYEPFRGHTIQAFLGSEYIMTNVFGYNMIPGTFKGAVEINANTDLKTILG
ncbi:MAG TPA: gluconate 2-dehydrogenase subunit 3 family protein [Ohtaekwangia sp.]